MKRTCILILGMHRSGTSALSGVLNILDVYLGSSLIGAMEQNAKGFYENLLLNGVNERLLCQAGSSWDDVFFDERKLANIEYLSELEEVLVQEFQHSQLFAIKDPRLAYLFPLYAKVLSDLDVEIKIIIPVRSPLEVAGSLRARDNFSTEKGLLLWAYNFLLSEKHSRGFPRVFTQFDDLLKCPESLIKLVDDKLGIGISSRLESKRALLSDFLMPGLKHQNISVDIFSDSVPKVVREIVSRVPFLNDNDLSKELDSLRDELFYNQAFFYNSDIISDLSELNVIKQSASAKDKSLDRALQEINAKDQEINERDLLIKAMIQQANERDAAIQALIQQVEVSEKAFIEICASSSWKLTRPLRLLATLIRRQSINEQKTT